LFVRLDSNLLKSRFAPSTKLGSPRLVLLSTPTMLVILRCYELYLRYRPLGHRDGFHLAMTPHD
ncbi:hypothetical protein DA099_09985, partial [Photobacterium damselae]